MFPDFLAKFLAIGQRIDDHSHLRVITMEERTLLESSGNILEDSAIIFVSNTTCLSRIRNNFFSNRIVLNGDFRNGGIFNSSLRNVVIDGNAVCIRDCALIESAYIAEGCSFIGNGPCVGERNLFFGSPLVLCEETGGRKLYMNPQVASLAAIDCAISSRHAQTRYNEETGNLKKNICSNVRNFFGKNTVLMKCVSIDCVWTEGDVRVLNGDLSSCFLGPHCEIRNAIVSHSIVGPLVSIEAFSVVENSILQPYSKIGIHAKVVHSVIGSYSHLESGECVSSLIGPFVGFHHQSLCIATYWPQGRGNIGYGANVGSNHTGKAPDQELFAGEGVFFGLATIVKFPSNFTAAPYTLIASGVVCLPQTVEFPFSLINSSDSGSLNEITPAWMLSDNMFALLRSESKFQTRQKLDAPVEWQIFRPEIITMVRVARDRLRNIPTKKDTYTERDIAGLGKNFLREPIRLKAIDTYGFIIRWYVLRALFRQVEAGNRVELTREMEEIFISENLQYSSEASIKSLLKEFALLDEAVATSCVASKAKDDVRGGKIIGHSYAEFHAPANTHPVCVGAITAAKQVDQTVQRLLAKM